MKSEFRTTRLYSFVFRLLRVILIFGIAGAMAMALYRGGETPRKKERVQIPPSVRVATVSPESRTMVVEAFGTVTPRNLVKISVEVPGRIEYLHPQFVEGGFIPRGDLLVGIDQRSYELDRKAAQVRIRQIQAEIQTLDQDIENLEKEILLSQANVDLAFREVKRMRTLSRNDFASQTSLDRAEQSHLGARIQLQAIENRLALQAPVMEQKKAALAMATVDFQKADLAVEKTRIRSEFDGFILEKAVEQGEMVGAGQVLGSFYEQGALDVDVRIPMEEMQWIQGHFKDNDNPEARIAFSNRTDRIWEARVARIKANMDEKTRTLPMTLEIRNEKSLGDGIFDLKPGSFVRCEILGDVHENLFVVPRHLLKSGDRLYLATDNLLEIRKVDVLRKVGDRVYIRRGLTRDDRIIASPLPGAVEGMALTIKAGETAI